MSVDNDSGGRGELGTRWRGAAKVLSALAVLIGCIAAVAQCYQYLAEGRFNLVLAAVSTLLGILGIAVLFVMKDRRAAMIGAIVMVGVLVAAFGTGAWLYPSIWGVEVTREPGATPGANPFMPPVGTDQPGVVPPPNTEGAFAGDTQGLYGGTRNKAACDPKQMVAFLQQHPDKAAAWAGVLGIGPEAIPGYVATLTPAILRSDTYVTNHGFAGGQATSFPAVLQAGTAVLVNNRGVPVTKCFCGNPLTEPPRNPARSYAGPTWAAFSPKLVTTIRPAKADIKVFTIVTPNTNEVFDRPAGTTGEQDKDSTAQQGGQGAPEAVTLDGLWRNTNNSATMTIDHSGGQTNFRWSLLANPNNPGLRGFKTGPRPESCATPTTSIKSGGVQLACQDPREGARFNIGLNVVDRDHVTIDGDAANFFIPLSGSYVRS